ncbi:MAG: hypothetical protein ACLQVA_04495 [Candidatus Brocadiia bacterium]
MTTEERLEKLEKESAAGKRRVRWLAIGGAVGLACVAILVALRARPAEVQARRFVLVDANGKTRALLSMEQFGARLSLDDAEGKTCAELYVVKTGPVLSLSDWSGNEHARLSVLKDGPVLNLGYGSGKTRALLTVEEGGAGMRLYGGNHKILWSAP